MSRRGNYVWGSLNNTEPPDDDDDEAPVDFEDSGLPPDDGPDEHAAEVAVDRYERDIDERAKQ